jgi:catechol 2,3-dioxygenase-like lactoylglutathione lyase family enzyme
MKAPAEISLRDAAVVAFVPTQDFAQARAFYEGTLDLPLLAADEFALLFEANGTRIRVAKVGSFAPAPFTILGWRVADIHQTVAALGQRGVTFERFPGMAQDKSGVWTAPSGARVAWFKDPDGNVLSVSHQI